LLVQPALDHASGRGRRIEADEHAVTDDERRHRHDRTVTRRQRAQAFARGRIGDRHRTP
jgi:hypothetical protein